MRVWLPSLLLATLLFGCDATAPGGEGVNGLSASPFSGKADGASSLAPSDSVDLVLVFVSSVSDPGLAFEQTFTGQDVRRRAYIQEDVRRRAYIQESMPAIAIRIPSEAEPILVPLWEAHPLVASVERDIVFTLPETSSSPYVSPRHDYKGRASDLELGHDPTFSGQMLPWSVRGVGGDRSSAASGDGAGTVPVDVYVIDSGVDHADLNVVEAVTFFEGDDAGSSLHGTHVAGIIAAQDDGDGAVGVAPGARIHSLDVFDSSEEASMSQLLQAIDHVIAAKRAEPSRPMVINLSVGAIVGTMQYNALDIAVQVAIDEGIPVVVAAGNQSIDASTVSPAHVHDAITVGATDSERDFAVEFSNNGDRLDILAPGVRVISTGDGDRFARLTGTSMAAPHVTGAIALILSANPGLTPYEVGRAVGRNSHTLVGQPAPHTTDRILWVARL